MQTIMAILGGLLLGAVLFGGGYYLGARVAENIGAERLAGAERELAEYRERTERELVELGSALDGARIRSERAGRGLEEATRTAGGISDRAQRIIVLVRAIRSAIAELDGGDGERAGTGAQNVDAGN